MFTCDVQGAKVEHFDVSNVIYHKFSHSGVSHTLNGENVNVMLEFTFSRPILAYADAIWSNGVIKKAPLIWTRGTLQRCSQYSL